MSKSFKIYRILLPPLFALYCSCVTIPAERGPRREHRHQALKMQRRNEGFLLETNNSSVQSPLGAYAGPDSFAEYRYVHSNTRRRRRSYRIQRMIPPNSDNVTIDATTRYAGIERMGLHFHKPQKYPPDFMVKLFHALSSIHSRQLKNTIVTSYVNINLQEHEDIANNGQPAKRRHTLVFNGSTALNREDVDHAELRLFFSQSSSGSDVAPSENCLHQIKIYDNQLQSTARTLIFSDKRLIGANSWNEFDLTSAIRMWDPSSLYVIDVEVEFLTNRKGINEHENNETQSDEEEFVVPEQCMLVAETDPRGSRDPILVVFSKKAKVDKRGKKGTKYRKKREALVNNKELEKGFHNNDDAKKKYNIFHDNHNVTIRSRYGTHSVESKLRSPHLINNIYYKTAGEYNEDLSWIRFIKEKLQSDNSAVNQTNLHDQIPEENEPKSQREKQSLGHGMELSNDHGVSMLPTHRMRREARTRSKRSRYSRYYDLPRYRRNRRYRNSCRRKEMYVDFTEIQYNFILFPTGYQAFECTGRCYSPIAKHLSPTKHAIIQTLYHTSHPRRASRACCVPTRLAPISVLYTNDNNNVEYQYTYEDMVVKECGCR